MCLGLATGYREPADKKECTYADLKQIHFPENIIDTELTSDDFLKALEYVKEYEKAIKEEQAIVNNGDEFHIEALKVCEVVKQALVIATKAIEDYNRQQAEIERLEEENRLLSENADTAFQDGLNEAQDLYAEQIKGEIKDEAIKEFAERLKEKIYIARFNLSRKNEFSVTTIDPAEIDSLLKEMVGEDK